MSKPVNERLFDIIDGYHALVDTAGTIISVEIEPMPKQMQIKIVVEIPPYQDEDITEALMDRMARQADLYAERRDTPVGIWAETESVYLTFMGYQTTEAE